MFGFIEFLFSTQYFISMEYIYIHIYIYISLPSSSYVCLSDLSSKILMYLLLFRTRVYSVKYAKHRRTVDC